MSAPASFATELPPIYIERIIQLDKNETLADELIKAGVNTKEAYRVISAIKKKYSLRKLPLGQKFTAHYKEDSERNPGPLLELSFHTKNDKTISVKPSGSKFIANVAKRQLRTERVVAQGEIEGSLYVSAVQAGLPAAKILPFANLFGWEMDFTRDIREGDTFRVVFEKYLDDDDNFVRNGPILAAQMKTRGKLRHAYRAEYKKGHFSYYDEKGINKRRMLIRTPLNFTRISSHFNPHRKHPILGYTRAHKGTDFAAPTGTPVWAAGDGIIEEIRWKGGYGRYIRVRHDGTYKTAYAHLHRYAKGMKKGKRVKQGQVLAYVGSTGRSTGPHLHYEVIKRGSKVNALRVKLPNGAPLPKSKRTAYKTQVAKLQKLWAPEPIQLAQR